MSYASFVTNFEIQIKLVSCDPVMNESARDCREHHENQHIPSPILPRLSASWQTIPQDKTTKNKDIENTNQTILTTPFPYLCSDSQRRKEIQLGIV